MCRSIQKLRQPSAPATEEQVRAASLQFVRKVSGYRAPSQRNRVAFDRAVDEIAAATARLLAELESAAPPSSHAHPGTQHAAHPVR